MRLPWGRVGWNAVEERGILSPDFSPATIPTCLLRWGEQVGGGDSREVVHMTVWVDDVERERHSLPGSCPATIQTCPHPLEQHFSLEAQSLSLLHIWAQMPALPSGSIWIGQTPGWTAKRDIERYN